MKKQLTKYQRFFLACLGINHDRLQHPTIGRKLKQAQRGDIVVTDSGARLPFDCVSNLKSKFMWCSLKKNIGVVNSKAITDIIRPAPEPKAVPEIVEWLRKFIAGIEYAMKEIIKADVILSATGQ